MLWFNASHERDIVPLLDALASARRRASSRRLEDSNSNAATSDDGDGDDNKDDGPLFDEAWFMEVNPGRPSRFAHPTAQELLAPHYPPPASVASVVSGGSEGNSTMEDDVPKESAAVSSRSGFAGAKAAGPTEAIAAPEGGEDKKPAAEDAEAGAWQRTLQQVACCRVKQRLCVRHERGVPSRCLRLCVTCQRAYNPCAWLGKCTALKDSSHNGCFVCPTSTRCRIPQHRLAFQIEIAGTQPSSGSRHLLSSNRVNLRYGPPSKHAGVVD